MTTNAPSDSELIDRLDLATKIRLLTGGDVFTTAAAPEIGLRSIALSDGPTGLRGLNVIGGRPVALFPNATLLASGWSEDSAAEVGAMLAADALLQHVDVLLGPTINLHRSPFGGRLFEAFSEDPLLTGKLAAAYVRGMQQHGVGACPRHLVANESETARNTMNGVVDEVTLRELSLLPFEIAVQESTPWSMMAAFNDVDGVPATQHDHVQNEIVKGDWGFDGLIMSDGLAGKTAGPAANGGLDLMMLGPDGPLGDTLLKAVQAGEVAESVIDDHLARLLRLAHRVGALAGDAPPRPDAGEPPAPDGRRRREQLTRLAAAGITVLINDDDILPLAAGTSIALIGRHAIETTDLGRGSAPNPPDQSSVADGLRALLGDDVTVTDGVDVRNQSVTVADVALIGPTPARSEDEVIDEAAAAAALADVAVVVVGRAEEQETEAADRTILRLPGRQDELVSAVAAAARRTVVVINSATPVIMPWLAEVNAVLWAGLPGQQGGQAIAATLVGLLEPAGRLVTTFPADDELAPAWSVTPDDGGLVDSEGTAIGYRGHYAGAAPRPAFWFGHGLGYSSWNYLSSELLQSTEDSGGQQVGVRIRNIGRRASREVVQVYFRPAEHDQPVRLAGWGSATVEPGAVATVLVPLDQRMWRRWDEGSNSWRRLSGRGELLIARGLGDIRDSIDLL